MMAEDIDDNSYEDLYLSEKKKSSILMMATIAMTIIAIGSFAMLMNKEDSSGESTTNTLNSGAQQQFGGQGRPGGQQGGPGGFGGGQGRGFNVEGFFSEDGTVDETSVSQLLDRLPQDAGAQFTDRFAENIDQAVTDGAITEAQASALKNALNSIGNTTDEI